MENIKDSIANTVSFAGMGAAFMNTQDILTIILLISGILLNISRLRNRDNK
tara:strand:+ start:3598 stop:3750 length:153 start_codon:yes stop_codon:yes gene_type:complete